MPKKPTKKPKKLPKDAATLAKNVTKAMAAQSLAPKTKGSVTVKVEVETPLPQIGPQPEGAKSPEILRLIAGTKYLGSFEGMTIAELAKDPELVAAGVTVVMLQNWCTAGQWQQARRSMYSKVFGRLRAKLEADLGDIVIKRLERFREIETRLYERILADSAEISSIDGGVRAFILLEQAMERVEAQARSVLDGAEAAHGLNGSTGEAGPSAAQKATQALIPEGTRELVRALIKKKQDTIEIKASEVPAPQTPAAGPALPTLGMDAPGKVTQ